VATVVAVIMVVLAAVCGEDGGGWRRRTKEKGIGRGFTKTNKPREARGRGE